jgi:ribosome biogenesis protein
LGADEQDEVKRFVTGSHDETLLIWEWTQRKKKIECVAVCRGHARSVDCIAMSPNSLQVI